MPNNNYIIILVCYEKIANEMRCLGSTERQYHDFQEALSRQLGK